MSISNWLRVAVLALSGLAVNACAEEREPINKVQANALAKSFFVGDNLKSLEDDPEFYTAATVVDVPYGADQMGVFPGLIGGLRRVKWEILEDVLNARMTYEEIDGSDGHGNQRANNGRVIAAFPIEKHFDIRRGYNAATGEELNVIEENETDRPWYERAYMRVDWSSNLVASSIQWDPMASSSAAGSVETETLKYYVDDPNHPDAPLFDAKEGYFDITNRLYLKPKLVKVNGQLINACMYRGSIVIGGSAPWGNCENTEVTVRYSFRRIAHAGEPGFTDYEPVEWDGARMTAFGAFITDRMGWDDRYGIIDNEWRRMANRYNIWQVSHTDIECNTPEYRLAKIPADIDADGDGTHDQCKDAGVGSRCDKLSGLCTIPYAKREIRTVAWHYTVGPDGDDVIFDWTNNATKEWDVALKTAVQTARLIECRRTHGASLGGTRWETATSCEQAFPMLSGEDAELKAVHKGVAYPATISMAVPPEAPGQAPFIEVNVIPENTLKAMTPVVVLCHNPVADTDDVSCGKIGTKIRPGDLRYHHVAVWPTRQNLSPWGYGPTLADPLTGEVISAGINVYNAVTDASAQSFTDQLRWMNGEIKTTDISSGAYIQDWSDDDDKEQQLSARAMGGSRMPRSEVQKRDLAIAGMAYDPSVATKAMKEAGVKINAVEFFKNMKHDLFDNRLPETVALAERAEFEQRINLAKGSKIEAQLTNAMWAQLAGDDTGDTLDEDILDQISPLRGMRSQLVRESEREIEMQLAKRGQCIVGAPEPTGLPALAKIMKKKFPPGTDGDGNSTETAQQTKDRVDRMFDYLRGRLHYSVILHEMGHTVSLRHNFVSSYDKFNFRPQYWQLRTHNGEVTETCKGLADEDPATCVGPRFYDPLTQEETDGSIWTWQHSTVMDYPGDLTQDMMGLGVYDYGAARMFYAGVADVVHDAAFIAEVPNPDDPDVPLVEGTPEGNQIASIVDFPGGLFGQIVFRPGYDPNNALLSEVMHYSEWNNWFHFIRNCRAPDPTRGEWGSAPPDWNVEKDGEFDPVFDGHVVLNTVCDRIPSDYILYDDLVPDDPSTVINNPEDDLLVDTRHPRDAMGRPRFPYGFSSDEYVNGWSPSTYQHDNGADLYEELTFHTNLYENRHIFDNFRNGRVNFTIWGAYQKALSRYHDKISNLTQGVAYIAGWYLKELAKNTGNPSNAYINAYFGQTSGLYDVGVGASLGFDHFVRVLTRPHVGPHYKDNKTGRLMPAEDSIGGTGATLLTIPNGTFISPSGEPSFGGRPLNNDFQSGHGYFNFDYFNQAGSYYEKTFAFEAMLQASWRTFNFWRFDGLDARFHHVNFSDLYGDGMRRLVGSMLTGDADLYAPRVSGELGQPYLQESGKNTEVFYPRDSLGWVSYVAKAAPELCFTRTGTLTCADAVGGDIPNEMPKDAIVIDPQLGFEVQKFIAFWTYVYQPGQQEMDWVDSMRIYIVGKDQDPSYLPDQQVVWRDPETGLRYIAKRYGDETILGKTYDKGIAAKMIQWANKLTSEAYVLDDVDPIDPVTGEVHPKIGTDGAPILASGTVCDDSIKCSDLRKYRGLMDFMRDTAAQLGFPEPALQIFGND